MKTSHAFIRARIDKIMELINYYSHQLNQDMSEDDEIYFTKGRVLLRNGVFPKEENEAELVGNKLVTEDYSNKTLSFLELTRFSSWFALHPKKVCGKEYATSAREFPVSVKGNKTIIIQTINKTLQISSFQYQLDLKKKIASTKLKLLKL